MNALHRLKEQTGFGLSAEDTILFLLCASVFIHWVLCAAALVFAALYVLCSKKRLGASLKPRYSIALLVVFLVLALQGVLLQNYKSALACLGVALLLLISFWVRSFMDASRFKRMLDTAIFAGFVSGGIALFQKFILYRDNLANYRPTGPTINANFYGMLLSMLLLATFDCFLRAKGSKRMLLYGISLFFNCGMLYLCESRAAQLGVICGVLLLLLWRRCFKSFALLAGIGAAFVFLGLTFPALFSWSNSLFYIAQERIALWRIALDGIFASPLTALFGRGLFSFPALFDAAPHTFWEAAGAVPLMTQYHCHNLALECILSFGFVGFSLITAYVFTQVRVFVSRLKVVSLRQNTLFFLSLCLMALFESMADAALVWLQTGLFFMLCYTCIGIPKTEETIQ